MTLLDGTHKKIIIPLKEAPCQTDLPFQSFFVLTAMTTRFLSVTAVLSCALLASCYPYDESQNRRQVQPPQRKAATTAEQQKQQEQRDALKKKEEQAKKDEQAKKEEVKPKNDTPTTTSNPPPAPKRTEADPYASKVPGREGFVFSPYNNKIVDVRDIPSGTLVRDPTYTGEGNGRFRVP